MIIKFKIFENKELNFEELTKKYKNHFFIEKTMNSDHDWERKDFYLVLVTEIRKHTAEFPINSVVIPKGECFTVLKNGEFENASTYMYSKSLEEFNKINFLTPQELYELKPDLCIKIYEKALEVINSKKNWASWYTKQLKMYKELLDTVPDLQHYEDSVKYNL